MAASQGDEADKRLSTLRFLAAWAASPAQEDFMSQLLKVATLATEDELEEDDNYFAPESMIAGACSGLVAETLAHPFETISTRSKVHPTGLYSGVQGAKRIFAEEGFRGIFAGIRVTLLSAPPQTALYFTVYEMAKRIGLDLCPSSTYYPLVYFTAGACSELVSSMTFMPCEVLRNRFQLGANPFQATGGRVHRTTTYPSIWQAASTIVKEKGVSGLFVGWRSCLLQDAVYSASQFAVYEQIKRTFFEKHMSTPEALLCGALAGACAATITNPFDMITTRLMTQDSASGFGSSILSVAKHAFKEGPLSLFRGVVPRVVSITPAAAVQFAVYEHVKNLLVGE